jgi:hypothetical protein
MGGNRNLSSRWERLLVGLGGDQGRVHVDDDPAGHGLAGDDQPPSRSSARRTVGPLGAAPSTGARWDSTPMSLMLVAPRAIAAAIETRTIPRPGSDDVPAFRSAELSAAVSPAWSAALRSRTVPAWPTRPFPSA